MSEMLIMKQAQSIACKMLAVRSRTCQQVMVALQRKGIAAPLAGQVVAELMEAGYLNDCEFSENYIAVRLEQKPRGLHYFQARLYAAGIERALAWQVLSRLYPPEREKEEALRFVRILKEGGVCCPHKVQRKLHARGFTGTAIRHAGQQEV